MWIRGSFNDRDRSRTFWLSLVRTSDFLDSSYSLVMWLPLRIICSIIEVQTCCITPLKTACSVHISLCGLHQELVTFHCTGVCLETEREYLAPAGGLRAAENSREARVRCKRNKRRIERCCVCPSSSVDSSHSNLKAALCFTGSNDALLSFSFASGIYSLHKERPTT